MEHWLTSCAAQQWAYSDQTQKENNNNNDGPLSIDAVVELRCTGRYHKYYTILGESYFGIENVTSAIHWLGFVAKLLLVCYSLKLFR